MIWVDFSHTEFSKSEGWECLAKASQHQIAGGKETAQPWKNNGGRMFSKVLENMTQWALKINEVKKKKKTTTENEWGENKPVSKLYSFLYLHLFLIVSKSLFHPHNCPH